MTVHLRKLCVGIESVEHLEEVHAHRLAQAKASGGPAVLYAYTRNTPKRKDEVLDGGCMYWVIKGQFRCRQEIIGFENGVDEEGRKFCLIQLKPGLIKVEPRAQKPFQGWRYFEEKDAPSDLDENAVKGDDLPEEMQSELRDLGLL
ncbi:DUF1489 family protein [Terasakiella pusilla]|jgi:hypothetical protein|uniref:DUF1489 family protein n=1 Tax=Terasakiella pusilla TaxID=64973 RepID=UPI003AA87CCF